MKKWKNRLGGPSRNLSATSMVKNRRIRGNRQKKVVVADQRSCSAFGISTNTTNLRTRFKRLPGMNNKKNFKKTLGPKRSCGYAPLLTIPSSAAAATMAATTAAGKDEAVVGTSGYKNVSSPPPYATPGTSTSLDSNKDSDDNDDGSDDMDYDSGEEELDEKESKQDPMFTVKTGLPAFRR